MFRNARYMGGVGGWLGTCNAVDVTLPSGGCNTTVFIIKIRILCEEENCCNIVGCVLKTCQAKNALQDHMKLQTIAIAGMDLQRNTNANMKHYKNCVTKHFKRL